MTANISQLQNIYSYLQQSGIGASATSSNDNFMNTIWSSLQDFQSLGSDNDQQKAAGMQNLLNKVMDLISTLGGATKEAAKAKNETTRNSSDARNVEAKASETEAKIAAEIEKIQTELGSHIEVIEKASENIEGKKDELNAQLEALKTIQEQIQQKQQALNDPNQKDKATILNDIKALASIVPAITSTLTGIQEAFEAETQNVANAFTAVEALKGNTIEVQTNGQEEIIGLVATTTQEVQDNAKSNQTAVVENVPTSEAAKKAATAASTNAFTASKAPQLFQTSLDQKIASTTRITGSATNLQTLQQGIGKINSSNEALTGFSTEIENQLNTFNTAIGAWDEAIQPMIKSIGSVNYEEIEKAAEELEGFADEDLSTLPKTEENQKETNVTTETNLKTSTFDISKLGIKVEKETK